MTKPFKYQKIGILKIRKFGGRALLADEMGLGKSLQALVWCKKMPDLRPVIIVCPASLKLNWEREAIMHTNMPVEILEGQKPPKKPPIILSKIYVINYDILRFWVPYLRKLNPKVIVLDEVHFIKDKKTKRYKAVKSLCRKVKHVIAISGTPLTNRPKELWPTLNLLRPDLYKSFMAFAMRYCAPVKMKWGWEFNGATNLAELHSNLRKTMMVRRLKKDVLKELPDKLRHVVPIQISNKAEYTKASTDFLNWLGPRAAKKAKKAEALVRIGALKRLAAQLKLPALFEWLDNFLATSDGKIAVYGIHVDILTQLYDRYGSIGVLVNGSVKGHARDDAVSKFQHNPKCRMFFGNIKAAGTGLTLTAASDLAIVEFPWSPGDVTQVEDRIHRIGQKNVANIHYLVAYHTIEEDLISILQTKQSILDRTLDGIETDDNLDVFTQLIKLTRHGK